MQEPLKPFSFLTSRKVFQEVFVSHLSLYPEVKLPDQQAQLAQPALTQASSRLQFLPAYQDLPLF